MKKLIIKLLMRLSFLSLSLLPIFHTSCSEDDNEKKKEVSLIRYQGMEVETGMQLYAFHIGETYVFDVLSAEEGKVVLSINDKEIVLTDTGTQFCSMDFKAITKETAEADPINVLLALSPKSKIIVDPRMCGDETLEFGSDHTQFTTADKKEGIGRQ